MRKVLFGQDEVSCLALGSSDFGGKCAPELAFELMDAFRQISGNFIDTAHMYGDFVTPKNGESEKVIGRWLDARHNRKDIFISTKGAHPLLSDMHTGRLSRTDIRTDMQESLDALHVDYVDIFYLHRDDVTREVGDIMESLQSLLDDGFAKRIGVSNWTTKRIIEANAYANAHGLHTLDANQPRFSLAKQFLVEDDTLVEMDKEMYDMHVQSGMVCTPFSSQAKGFFTKLDKLGEDGLPDKAKRRYLYPENIETFKRVKAIQHETGYSVEAIALAYLTSQPFTVIPLCGASHPEQVLEWAEASDAVLNKSQVEYLYKW